MRKISEHVRAVLKEHPFFSEVLREGIGNATAIARRIKKDVEKRAYGSVSVSSITMALLRTETRPLAWGHRYLRNLQDITVRGNLMAWYVTHESLGDRYVYQGLAKIVEKHQGVFCNVIYGVRETVIIAHRDLEVPLKRMLFGVPLRNRRTDLSAITVRFPEASLLVPGVYYSLLQAIAWEGISIEEVVSVGTEFSLICRDSEIERVLSCVRTLSAARS
jgi:hypothetical protein